MYDITGWVEENSKYIMVLNGMKFYGSDTEGLTVSYYRTIPDKVGCFRFHIEVIWYKIDKLTSTGGHICRSPEGDIVFNFAY